MTVEELEANLRPIETEIQRLLLNLEDEIASGGYRITGLNVDTRRWGNMAVTVLTVSHPNAR